ncbi:MAG: GNAT family N-acetyltransferase [Deltaproteobacteria bacterium HGW-Deltaproteobacteria-14]|nr:MAG: GNAT family N-acetyltransferase [Deltaproteobacteria bacterium HGW-Deltaproteobacteria-14]
MSAPTIRRAGPGDAAVLRDFNVTMAAETEGVALDPDRVGRGVAGCLADPAKGFYLVAERDGAPVGQTMVTYEWSDWRDGTFFWIQSVYVRPEERGQGVFRSLYEAVLAEARARGDVAGVRLYVHHDNARAQAVYAALGMAAAEYRMFEVDFVLAR